MQVGYAAAFTCAIWFNYQCSVVVKPCPDSVCICRGNRACRGHIDSTLRPGFYGEMFIVCALCLGPRIDLKNGEVSRPVGVQALFVASQAEKVRALYWLRHC